MTWAAVDARRFDAEEAAADPSFQDLVWQELRQELARRLNVDPREVKPCLARVGAVDEGIRNETAYMIATEYRRMGATETVADSELGRWGRLCRPPLSACELRSVFKSAWNTTRAYGCRGKMAAQYCIGRERCPWFAANMAGAKRRGADEVYEFMDAGWPALLTSAEVRVYMALLRLEAFRGVGGGAVIIASTRDYAGMAGVARNRVLDALAGLEARGLLVLVDRGQCRGAGLPPKACQVIRVCPIPEGPVVEVNRRREALCG